jgi:hypothetical protein
LIEIAQAQSEPARIKTSKQLENGTLNLKSWWSGRQQATLVGTLESKC